MKKVSAKELAREINGLILRELLKLSNDDIKIIKNN